MKKLFNCTLILLVSTTLFSQNNPYWIAGGNPNAGPDAVNATNNILGPTTNIPMRIVTGNTHHLAIFQALKC